MSSSAEARSILGPASSSQARQQIAEAVEDALSTRIARDLGAFVEQLVAIVRTEADARTAEAESEAARLRARLDERAKSAEQLARALAATQADLDEARREAQQHADTVAALRHEHDTLVRARTLAEEAWEQVEAESHRLRVTFERRIRDLEAELTAQRTLGAAPASVVAAASAAAPELPPPPPARSLTLVEPIKRGESPSVRVRGDGPQLDAYVTELIEQLKTAYAIDLAAGLAPTALVDRLMANVRGANEAFAREIAATGEDAALLDRRLTDLIDAEASTSFGRHLAVALYVVGPKADPAS